MQVSDRYLCADCVGDSYLAKRIQERGIAATCSFCNEEASCAEIDVVCRWLDDVLRENYQSGHEEPDYWSESDSIRYVTVGESLESIVHEATGADGPVVEALCELLISTDNPDVGSGEDWFYAVDQLYEFSEFGDFEHRYSWEYVRHRIMHERRFFDSEARRTLSEILAGIERIRTRRGSGLIRMIGSGRCNSMIYRSRRANSADERKRILSSPETELGAPPHDKAGAGRMNAEGIPVFYGALAERTAVDELRLAIGENALVAGFRVTRPLRVIDLTRLAQIEEALYHFDPDFRSKLSRLSFLRGFGREISIPVLPALARVDYLPTQAVAEYLFYETGLNLDGIVYASAQRGGPHKNIALRFDSCAVASVTPDAKTGESAERELWVEERVSYYTPEPHTSGRWLVPDSDPLEFLSTAPDRRITLELDRSSIRVYTMTGTSKRYEQRSVDSSGLDYQVVRAEEPQA